MSNILQESKAYIRARLRDWYLKQKRELPWRETQNAYHIWLSEIILQQTRVEQGLPYYLRFTETFPTISDLALAPEDQVMRLWQGLGYYSRARNLHKTAQLVHETYEGSFPAKYESIRALPGIGDYTAAAIASFAFRLPHAAVDGNVYRVLSRLANNPTPIDSTAGKHLFKEMAETVLDPEHPDLHNQAMMELGATVCKPQQPMCLLCPLLQVCEAQRAGTISGLPVKSKKTKVKSRFLNYFLVENGAELLLRKRPVGDIWAGLYEFPLLETEAIIEPEQALQAFREAGIAGGNFHWAPPFAEVKHILTHQRLNARIYRLRFQGKILPGPFYSPVNIASLRKYALPRLLDKYLETHPIDL